MLRIIRKHTRLISITFSLVLLINVFVPSVSYAITGNNTMPEYKSFEPVSTTNMVNPQTGDFVYNVPLMNIPNGYPLNLSYHSAEVNSEAQASWVGLGWTLNPGAINRTKRGLPDEFNGATINYFSRIPTNWTLTMGVGAGAELFGFQGSLLTSLRYNNNKGFGRTLSGSIGYEGLINLGFSYEAGHIRFSPTVNPMALAMAVAKAAKSKKGTSETPESEKKKADDEFAKKVADAKTPEAKAALAAERNSSYEKKPISFLGLIPSGAISAGQPISVSLKTPEYQGYTFNIKFEGGVNIPPLPLDVSGIVTGAFVTQIYKNKELHQVPTYGYFNMEGRQNGSSITDSYSEIENVYEKKDRYLAIPFANYDVFNMTGEGMGGSFRGFRTDFGHFYPESSLSTTIKGNIGIDVAMPSILTFPTGVIDLETTVGTDIGGGYGEIRTSDWIQEFMGDTKNPEQQFKGDDYYKATTNEKIVFRLGSDKSGSINKLPNDNALRAELNSSFLTSTLVLPNNLTKSDQFDLTKRVGRASYISVKKNSDFTGKLSTTTQTPYDVYQKTLLVQRAGDPTLWDDYNAGQRTQSNGLGEIVNYNNDGVRYVYGLPMRVKNEKSINVNVKRDEIANNFEDLVVYTSNTGLESSSATKSGYESPSAYASQFLLTQITSPDFVDRTMDGLTPDDFGSYTRFNYAKAMDDATWYKFRTPFKGLSFNHGSLSDGNDDMGTYSAGEKELYYIQSVSSKTHVAIFVTSDRQDGKSVTDVGVLGGGGAGSLRLKKLDRIDMYAIADCDQIISGTNPTGVYKPKAGVKPIQSTCFKYDYSLCKDAPNSDDDPANSGHTLGKLTLNKIWFEYEGKVKSVVSPYTFKYNYPASGTYPTRYAGIESPLASSGAAVQNPNYNVVDSDGWGNYRNFAQLKSRLGGLAHFFSFVDQQGYSNEVDPAAWCLKQIKLPSGGEIHIQYEQHDYQYVQDQRAMIMVPLSSYTVVDEDAGSYQSKPYYIDLAKAGISTAGLVTDDDYMNLAHELFKPMTLAQNNNRMYFSFLYSLIGYNDADYTKLYSDYIEGYAHIAGYGVYSGKIYFYFWDQPFADGVGKLRRIDLTQNNHNKWEMPRKACQEFYQSSRQGRISDSPNSMGEGDINSGSLANLYSKAKQIAGVIPMCARMSPTSSYVRLQLPVKQAKKGGGIRVKRLLMYDKGITSSASEKVLYGKEYSYKTEDGKGSSGVTPNEPEAMRRENVLVNPLDRDSQSGLEALLYGLDMISNEGPLGHSLYPGPAVTYSYVKISDIHTGTTSTGYEVQEFYTCKDFPFKSSYTGVLKQHDVPLGGGFISSPFEYVAPHLTQGYAFVMNDMHGKLKRLAKYPNNSPNPVYEEKYEYTSIGEPVRVMDENKKVSWQLLGKESEMFAERREINDYSVGASTGIDLTAGAWTVVAPPPPVPVPLIFVSGVRGYAFVSEQILRTHVTSKVISYSVMPKKTTILSDGIIHTTENLVFDKYTGNPVITRTMDDFSVPYINQTFMASWEYPNFQPKHLNERLYVTGGKITSDGTYYYLQFDAANNGCAALDNFVVGDFLAIRKDPVNTDPPALFHVAEIDRPNIRLKLSKSALHQAGTYAVLTGLPQQAEVNILQSGRTQQTNTQSGNIVAYNRPGIYDYTTPALSSTITAFLSVLNAAYAGGTNATISPAQIPAGLKMIDPLSGECVKGKDFSMEINFTKLNGKTYVKVGNKSNGTLTTLPASYALVTGATALTSGYRLTQATQPDGVNEFNYQRGAIWNQTKIDLSQCFDLRYKINLGSRNHLGADGMVFMLHNNPRGLTAIGAYGCDMGSSVTSNGDGHLLAGDAGIAPSFGVEFDTYFNADPPLNTLYLNDRLYKNASQQIVVAPPLEDEKDVALREKNIIHPPLVTCSDQATCSVIDFDHIDIFTNTVGNAYPTGSLPVAAIPDNSSPFGSRNIEDGLDHDVRFIWNPTTQVFRVYFDGLLRKQVVCDLRALTGGSQTAYYGWTAGQSLTNTQVVKPVAAYSGCSGSPAPGCASVVNGVTGTFGYDPITGYIQFTPTGGCAQNVDCLTLCEANDPVVLGGIIAANAKTFDHVWDFDATKYPLLANPTTLSNFNEFETGARGKWRVKDMYSYRTAIKDGLNYASGEMKDFTLFNWKNPEVNNTTKWLLSTSITQYTPNGEVYEDKNILDIYSTAIYGYNNTLPIAVAQNAKAKSIFFESFENYYAKGTSNYYLENGYEVPSSYVTPDVSALRTSAKAHTGKYSFKLATNTYYSLGKITTEAASTSTTRVWISSDYNIDKLKGNVTMNLHGTVVPMTYVSSAGSWMQFEASVTPIGLTTSDLQIKVNPVTGVNFGNIYVDDIRNQHDKSEMTTYVYDRAQRLVAVFDDRHYAMIYQYNSQGLLVRKLKETIEGIKTISETQYNTPGEVILP
jgi:YD repeat-containing protein